MANDPKAIKTTYRWIQTASGEDSKKDSSLLLLSRLTCEPAAEGGSDYRVVLDSFWDYNIDGTLDAYKRREKIAETCPSSFNELPPDMKITNFFESGAALHQVASQYGDVRTAAMSWFKELADEIVKEVQQPKCVSFDNSSSLYLEGKQHSLSVYAHTGKKPPLLTGAKIMQENDGNDSAVFYAELVIKGKQPKKTRITAPDVKNFLGDFTKIFQDKCGNGNK